MGKGQLAIHYNRPQHPHSTAKQLIAVSLFADAQTGNRRLTWGKALINL